VTPEQRIRLHSWAAWLWLALAVATTGWALVDSENHALLAWVIFMSAYANTASHWSAKEGAAPSADGDELSPGALAQIEAIVERAVAQGSSRPTAPEVAP
jgi:hypothetical protein